MNGAWHFATSSKKLMAMGELAVRKYNLLKFVVILPNTEDSELCESRCDFKEV
jgi:hypothetical protein